MRSKTFGVEEHFKFVNYFIRLDYLNQLDTMLMLHLKQVMRI